MRRNLALLFLFRIYSIFVTTAVCSVKPFIFLLQMLEHVTIQALRPIAFTIVPIFILFLLCYVGTEVSSKVTCVANSAYNMDWYNFPLKLQTFVLLIMIRGQEPFYLSGCGLMSCTLNNFLQVI